MKPFHPVGIWLGAGVALATTIGFLACNSDDTVNGGSPDGSSSNDATVPGSDSAVGDSGIWDSGAQDSSSLDDGSPDDGSLDDGSPDDGSPGDGSPGDGSSADAAATTVSVPITVHPDITLANIGADFAGFSFEKSHMIDGYFRGTNEPLIKLFKLLGPSLLRIGGNSVDRTLWDRNADAGVGDGGVGTPIAPGEVDNLADFVKASDWKILYGVNMKRSPSPSVAAEEASYAAGKFGDSLYGFEIGNENDLYPGTALQPTWNYANFVAQWESFADAMRGGVPDASFTGPASAGHYSTWTVPFAQSEKTRIILLTQHYYRGNGQLATSTLDLLLSPDPNLPTELQALAKAAADNRIAKGYRLAEANSFYNGGRNGVSNAYGTAMWVVDFLFTNAKYGSSGVNFHGGGNSAGYTPIADANGNVVGVRPEYYGLLLFRRAGTGPMYQTDVAAQNLNFTAYSIGQSDGSTKIIVLNKDANTTVHATLDLGKNVARADAIRLRGPDLAGTDGVTLGGAPVQIDGTWAPNAPETLATSGHTVTIDIPPVSAALIGSSNP